MHRFILAHLRHLKLVSADLSGLTVGVTGGTLEDLELKVAPSDAKITRFGDNAAIVECLHLWSGAGSCNRQPLLRSQMQIQI